MSLAPCPLQSLWSAKIPLLGPILPVSIARFARATMQSVPFTCWVIPLP